jgi:hypothetical protein
MKLASLKETSSDWSKPVGAESDEYYPTIYLNEKQIKSLKAEGHKVGDELTFVAKVRVASTSETKNGAASLSMELIEGCLHGGTDAAKILYGEKD